MLHKELHREHSNNQTTSAREEDEPEMGIKTVVIRRFILELFCPLFLPVKSEVVMRAATLWHRTISVLSERLVGRSQQQLNSTTQFVLSGEGGNMITMACS